MSLLSLRRARRKIQVSSLNLAVTELLHNSSICSIISGIDVCFPPPRLAKLSMMSLHMQLFWCICQSFCLDQTSGRFLGLLNSFLCIFFLFKLIKCIIFPCAHEHPSLWGARDSHPSANCLTALQLAPLPRNLSTLNLLLSLERSSL